MKLLRNLLLVGCIAIFASCVETEDLTGDGSSNYDGFYTVQLPTSVNGKTSWLPGDKLVVHGEYSKDQQIITLDANDISEDGKVCTIYVSGVTPYDQKGTKTKYYIAYPGELVSNASHCKDVSTFSSTNAILLAGYQKKESFILMSLVGGLTFTVDGDFDSYELRGNNGHI